MIDWSWCQRCANLNKSTTAVSICQVCRSVDGGEKEPTGFAHIPIFQGVGKEAPTVINEAGGKQAKLDYRFDLIDAKALFSIANVLHEGEIKYGKDNWRKIEVESHLNHAISHIYAYLAGDNQDEHLSHAACRVIMALGVKLGGQATMPLRGPEIGQG